MLRVPNLGSQRFPFPSSLTRRFSDPFSRFGPLPQPVAFPLTLRFSLWELVLPRPVAYTPPALALPSVPRRAASSPRLAPRPKPPAPKDHVPKKLTPLSGSRPTRTLLCPPDRPSAAIQRVNRLRIQNATRNPGARRARRNPNPRLSPFHCAACKVTCTGRVQFADYTRSRRHYVRTNQKKFKCHVCNLRLSSEEDLTRHRQGRAHRDPLLTVRNHNDFLSSTFLPTLSLAR